MDDATRSHRGGDATAAGLAEGATPWSGFFKNMECWIGRKKLVVDML